MSPVWMKPVTGPKAWRGEQLVQDRSWLVTLAAAELAEIDRAVATAQQTGLPLEEVTREHFPLGLLARRLAEVLDEIVTGRGFVVLRGLPVRRYSDADVGLIFWGIGRYLGAPLYQNPKGDLLGHVFHDKTRTYGDPDVRGYISNAYLPYHTDGCDLVGLLSLREALEGGRSSLVSSVTVYNEILANHPEYLGLLYSGFYYIRREEVFTGIGVSERPVPVFGAQDGVVSCRYLRRQIDAGAARRGVPLTVFERAALDYLDSLTERADLRLDMDLEPGDMQLCNNYTILHSRTEFRDGPEPHQQRHLLRLWLKFPTRWPLSPHFPEHAGYRLAATGATPSRPERRLAMPRILSDAQVRAFEEQGFLSPIRAMSAERARGYRQRFEALEARFPGDMKKMKTKSHLLCPWVLEIAEDPHILDTFEDLIGPDIRCWSMAWRVKKADGETFAGWHQDSVYGSPIPVVLGALALSACGPEQGCLRGFPGSHRWGHLKHEESDDPRSILARGQYITDPLDEAQAVDFALEPGEMVMFHNSLVHGSAANRGPDRRFLLLVEMVPTWAERPRGRESAMLLRGADLHGAFDDEPRPDGEFTAAALANWQRVAEARGRRLFQDSRLAPSEAYGGVRAAT